MNIIPKATGAVATAVLVTVLGTGTAHASPVGAGAGMGGSIPPMGQLIAPTHPTAHHRTHQTVRHSAPAPHRLTAHTRVVRVVAHGANYVQLHQAHGWTHRQAQVWAVRDAKRVYPNRHWSPRTPLHGPVFVTVVYWR